MINVVEAKKEFIRWLGRDGYTVKDIFDKIKVTSFKGMYLPLYSYTIHYNASYSCDISISSTVRIDGKDQRVSSRVPHSGSVSGRVKGYAIGSDFIESYGPERVVHNSDTDSELWKAIEFVENKCVYTVTGNELENGFEVIYHNLNFDSVYDGRVRSKVHDAVERRIIEVNSGRSVTNIHFSVRTNYDIFETSQDLYRFVYVARYTYNGRGYIAFIGITDKGLECYGTRPMDFSRKKNNRKCYISALMVFFVGFVLYMFTAIINANSKFASVGLWLMIFGALFAVWKFLYDYISKNITARKSRIALTDLYSMYKYVDNSGAKDAFLAISSDNADFTNGFTSEDATEEINKYRALCASGVITTEEFNKISSELSKFI